MTLWRTDTPEVGETILAIVDKVRKEGEKTITGRDVFVSYVDEDGDLINPNEGWFIGWPTEAVTKWTPVVSLIERLDTALPFKRKVPNWPEVWLFIDANGYGCFTDLKPRPGPHRWIAPGMLVAAGQFEIEGDWRECLVQVR